MRWAKKAKTHGLRLLRRQRPTVVRVDRALGESFDVLRGKVDPDGSRIEAVRHLPGQLMPQRQGSWSPLGVTVPADLSAIKRAGMTPAIELP